MRGLLLSFEIKNLRALQYEIANCQIFRLCN